MSESEADSVSEGSVNLVEDSFFRQIRDAVSRPQVAFCCAGKLPITAESSFEQIRDTLKDGQLKSGPVTIRWDRKDGKTISKVVLPIISGEGRGTGRPSKKQKTASDVVVTQSQAAIQDLLDDSAPASFGKGGKDVLDDSYRKAVKLDSDQFSTNFNPYDLGIIAAIAQTLLPGVARPILKKARPMSKRAKDCTFSECLGVIAELYKLNVYSSPSGKFKPHVDTPRGLAQFGTLVVCLPYRHEGGQLRVAHGGQETICDWGNRNDIVQWAAFYSDCEHEVYEVTAGHRITLTYNLYAYDQLDGFNKKPSKIDRDSYALYHRVKEALASPQFFPEGGTLGFHCVHAYAHANDRVIKTLPYTLKGDDAVIFSIFKAFGLSVSLHAVMEDLEDDFANERRGYESDDMNDADLVSTGLPNIQITDEGGDEDNCVTDSVENSWESEWRNDIEWFGRPGNQEIAVVHLAYGNQASAEWHYSTAAILVDIPGNGTSLRKALKAKRSKI